MSSFSSSTAGESSRVPAPEVALSHLDTLPTLTPIAVRLLQLTADEAGTVAEVVEALRGDQSLTARILALANSAAVGAPGKVSTLNRAVVVLGFRAVRTIVLTVKIFECLSAAAPQQASRHFSRTEFWKHALGVASAAKRLAAARAQLQVDPEEAFIAGLLHDLGKVALDAVFPKAYARAAAQAAEAHCEIADCERAVLGLDHTVAGRHLARRWGLPRALQDVIWLHHVAAETLTERVATPALIALVQLADALVREHHIGHSGNCAFYEPSARLAQYLGLSAAELEAAARSVVADVAEYAALLGLDEETPETLYLKSLGRANAELGRLNTELLQINRRLAAAARYFRGITEFDRQSTALSDLGAAVAAMANAARTALQRERLMAFGVHDHGGAVEVCRIGSEREVHGQTTEAVTEELRQWLRDPGDVIGATVTRAPPAVRALLDPQLDVPARGECWLLPVTHDRQIAGGITFFSERDERAELASEDEELRSFLASLGLALGRVNAQAAARRLSEDLAESNRRLQQMQAEILRTRALSMIAEMAAGAGHELNGPLTVISGRAQLLLDSTADPKARRALQQIHEKAHECAQIVAELMDFARPRPPEIRPIEIGPLLSELRQTWAQRAGLPPARFRVALPDEAAHARGPRLLGDREQIRTVLDELVANAVQAVAENEGIIEVLWQADIVDPLSAARAAAQRGLPPELVPARWIELTVRDTGCGMTPSVAQHVFDPFFSYRAAGRGRGLGLARAYRIVEAHGGRIWVESAPGQGTTLHVILPQAPTAEC